MPTIIAILAIIVIIVIWVNSTQRKLVVLDENISNAMIQVGVQLSSRFDALTALLDLTQGYANYESKMLIEVIKSRRSIITAKSTPDDVLRQEEVIFEALNRITMITEQYPNLKADKMYITNMGAVQTFENMIRTSCLIYNDSVTKLKVSGGAVWKKKWIFPYIADYRLTGHLDLGTYTGIGITATAKLKEAKEPWGMPWPNSAREAAATKKIFSLSESIKGALEEAEKFIPEEEATGSGGLAEKYARLMEDANEEWVDLFTANLLDLRSAVDPLHILAFGLKVDFVVSANLNVALGLTFQYENFKRHSFTLFVLSKNGESETIDLSTNGYQFDFYVIGHLGLRAGLRVKVTAGLFSTKLFQALLAP